MGSNDLKINQEKPELIVFAPKHKINYIKELSINIDGNKINFSSIVKKIKSVLIRYLKWNTRFETSQKYFTNNYGTLVAFDPLYERALVKPLYAHMWPLVSTMAMPYYKVYVPVPCQDLKWFKTQLPWLQRVVGNMTT